MNGIPGARGYPPELKREALRLRAQGLNRSEVARRLGISHTAIQRWEKPLAEARRHDRERQQAVRDRRNNQKDRRFKTGRRLLQCAVCGWPLSSEHLRPENWHRPGDRLHPDLVDDHRTFQVDHRKLVTWRLSRSGRNFQ